MLYLFYEGAQPIGIFDFDAGSDTSITANTIQGGMIGKLGVASDTTSPTIPLGDGFDEYGASGGVNPNIKTVIIPASTANTPGAGPYCIIDDGHTGYGTMFGHYFGHEASSTSGFKYYHAWRDGLLVGPNTVAGSGKVTGWITPGVYGTDYYDSTTIDLSVVEAGSISPGDELTISANATLTTGGTAFGSNQGCYFVSFLGDPSLVSTSFNSVTGGDTTNPIMLFMWK